MKIQKRISRIVNGKEYYQYSIVIPPSEVKESKLEGKQLKCRIENNNIIIGVKDATNIKTTKKS